MPIKITVPSVNTVSWEMALLQAAVYYKMSHAFRMTQGLCPRAIEEQEHKISRPGKSDRYVEKHPDADSRVQATLTESLSLLLIVFPESLPPNLKVFCPGTKLEQKEYVPVIIVENTTVVVEAATPSIGTPGIVFFVKRENNSG